MGANKKGNLVNIRNEDFNMKIISRALLVCGFLQGIFCISYKETVTVNIKESKSSFNVFAIIQSFSQCYVLQSIKLSVTLYPFANCALNTDVKRTIIVTKKKC